MKVKTGDKVFIRKGKDRGKTGKIIQVFPERDKVVVEGINMMKRHIRPQRRGEKGQVIEFSCPISVANVTFLCPKCEKQTRIGVKAVQEPSGKTKKMRVCKKCNETTE